MLNQTSKIKYQKYISKFKNLWSLICIFAFCNLIFGLTSGCQDQRLYRDNRAMMGTFVEVTSPDKNASEIVFNEIARIEKLLSKYDPQSEVSRLNATGKLKVSPETFEIIKQAIDFSRISNGAFDITVAPLIDLWGFTDKKFRVPSNAEIQAALKLVGSDNILLHENNNVVQFKLPDVKIDLGAIAKGFALDCAAKKLREGGIRSCLINAGGQVYALGAKSQNGSAPWKIAVKDPRGIDFSGFLEIKDASVSTSGDYEQYFVADGKRYSHILDPKTGYPADSGVISVTVTAPSATLADFLSTALFILGEEKSTKLTMKFPEANLTAIER